MEHKLKDGCWNCKYNWFGECEHYGYRTETEVTGVSVCDFDNWEKEE